MDLALSDKTIIVTGGAKGIGLARIEVAWGIYLFTACVISSILIAHFTAKRQRAGGA